MGFRSRHCSRPIPAIRLRQTRSASVKPSPSRLSFRNPGSVPPGPATPPPHQDGVCEEAIQLILACEVSSPQEYVKSLRMPAWPQGASGVTIGIGYDLGYVKPQNFRDDWQSELDAASLARLAECCGITGAAAGDAAAGIADLDVPWDAAERVFRLRTIPDYAARTRAALPNTGALAPDSFGALVSLVYNRGADFTAAGDRHAEMRAIHDRMAMAMFGRIPAELRSMKRLWQGVPGMSGLITRREREAALFETGLARSGAAQPVTADASQ